MDGGVAAGLVDLFVGDGGVVDAEDDVVSESAYGYMEKISSVDINMILGPKMEDMNLEIELVLVLRAKGACGSRKR